MLMRILRAACWAAAVLMVVFIGLNVWKTWFSASAATEVARGEYVLAGIMVAMLIGAVWLALSITRELKQQD